MNGQAKEKTDEAVWRSFPAIEKAVEGDSGPLMQKIEKTCRRLNEFITTGGQAERTRAQAAMGAYGRSLDLYRKLVEMRSQPPK